MYVTAVVVDGGCLQSARVLANYRDLPDIVA
jgi:hypothetical protein